MPLGASEYVGDGSSQRRAHAPFRCQTARRVDDVAGIVAAFVRALFGCSCTSGRGRERVSIVMGAHEDRTRRWRPFSYKL